MNTDINAARPRAAQQHTTNANYNKQKNSFNKQSKWPDPLPLPNLPEVALFNTSCLPELLRIFVEDISERMQCPPDFPAIAAITMAASVIGRKIGIRPMQENDWTVIPNLWGAAIGRSGVMKSPAIAAALAPLHQLQMQEFENFKVNVRKHEIKKKEYKLKEKSREREAESKLKKNPNAIVTDLLSPLPEDQEPTVRRYIVNDSSVEALAMTNLENPNGILVVRDEIIGLLKNLDQEGQQSARSFYLTAADGDKPFTVDRIGRGRHHHIEAVCISIIGGIQPGVLSQYVRQALDGGAGDDGLLQRFGLLVYPDISPHWKEIDRKPNIEIRQKILELITWLNNFLPADVQAQSDNFGGVPYLRFDSMAQPIFSEWRANLEIRLRLGNDHPAIESHLSKYRKLIPALSLIDHLCEKKHGAVDSASILRALDMAKYLETHAKRIYSYASRPDIEAAKTLLQKIMLNKLENHFTAREVYFKGWAALDNPERVEAAARILCDHYYLQSEPRKSGKQGGRPSEIYHVNPKVKMLKNGM